MKLTLSILPESLGICHFEAKSKVPDWALRPMGFRSITRTDDELSIVCVQKEIPAGVLFEKDWRAFKLENVEDFYSIGVISALAKPLAEAGINIFNISTYQTNYVLIEEKNLEKAKEVLSKFCDIR